MEEAAYMVSVPAAISQAGLCAIRRKKYKVLFLYALVYTKAKAPGSNLKSKADRAQ